MSAPYLFAEQERLRDKFEAAQRRLQSIDHVMYRHDEVVLALQLLAYLTKTPAQRALIHECPLLYSEIRRTNAATCPTNMSGYATPGDLTDAVQAAEAAAAANEAAGLPPARRYPPTKGTVVDVFSVVERFAFQRTFPSDM
ncbi:hypothetical protein EC988_009967, partial [Linderina pennispora]